MLVKASIAGAIVTNSLFMLGASFLLGGLSYRTQEFNRAGGRLHAALLLDGHDCPDHPAGGRPNLDLCPGAHR